MSFSLSWDVTQRTLIVADVAGQSLSVPSQRFKQTGCPETSATTNLRRVKFQKMEDLIYQATEVRNHAQLIVSILMCH
jgi:hypothetical protein